MITTMTVTARYGYCSRLVPRPLTDDRTQGWAFGYNCKVAKQWDRWFVSSFKSLCHNRQAGSSELLHNWLHDLKAETMKFNISNYQMQFCLSVRFLDYCKFNSTTRCNGTFHFGTSVAGLRKPGLAYHTWS